MPHGGKGNRCRHRAGRNRRAWATQVEPVPEEMISVPPVPAWHACVAGRERFVIEEEPFFVKVDVADFLDLDDSALSPDGRNGAMWEFHDFDEFEEAEEPFFVKVDVQDCFDIEDLKSNTLLGAECFDTTRCLAYFDELGDLDELEPPPPRQQPQRQPHRAAEPQHEPQPERQIVAGRDAAAGRSRDADVDPLSEPRARAKDVIWQDIRGVMERCPTLQPEDFDYRVRQLLHAMYGTGGRQRVLSGLEIVREAAIQKRRTSVHSWPAYIAALLKKADLSRDHEPRSRGDKVRHEADEGGSARSTSSEAALSVSTPPRSIGPSDSPAHSPKPAPIAALPMKFRARPARQRCAEVSLCMGVPPSFIDMHTAAAQPNLPQLLLLHTSRWAR